VEHEDVPRELSWADAAAVLRRQLDAGEAPDFDTRLRLAEVLLAAGRNDEAFQAFLDLVSEAEREGRTARAIAVLRRMEVSWPDDPAIESRFVEIARKHPGAEVELPAEELAAPPLPSLEALERELETAERPSDLGDSLDEIEALLDEPVLDDVPPFDEVVEITELDDAEPEFLELAAEVLRVPPPAAPQPDEASPRGIQASPLFSGLSEQEMMAILRRLRVADYEAGDILVTEGEQSQSVYVLSSGRANVFVRSPTGRDVLVALLGEGDFFGELSTISGSRRTATVSAATGCEVLELSKSDVDQIARTHPRVRDALDAAFVRRASNLAAAVARTIDLTAQGHVREHADVVLAARFGKSGWSPRVRLRLCLALLRAGHEEAAVPILAELANALVRAGRADKARRLLEKIQSVVSREIQEISLTPLKRKAAPQAEPSASSRAGQRALAAQERSFRAWLAQVVGEKAARPRERSDASDGGNTDARLLESYGPGLSACPLFEGLSPKDLTDLVGELRVLRVDAGDVIVTEGESGQSLFALLGGSVKVWALDLRGRNALVCRLEEGSFFGEVATLSGRPRCASVTAAEPCVLLELTRNDVGSLRAKHPHIGQVLDEYLAQRGGGASARA
jgi:CRP-like cAMP-binding protein